MNKKDWMNTIQEHVSQFPVKENIRHSELIEDVTVDYHWIWGCLSFRLSKKFCEFSVITSYHLDMSKAEDEFFKKYKDAKNTLKIL